jgi:hypothetical protein
MTAASNGAASQSILAHEAGGGKLSINVFGGCRAHVMYAAATITISLPVLSPVPTDIATVPDLEAAVSREGAEAVEGEEDHGKQEEEEDSNGLTYRIGEEDQEGALPRRDLVGITTAEAASTASEEKMNSTTSTMTNNKAMTTRPASTASTRNSTRKTTEVAEAGTLAGEETEGYLCNIYILTLRRR